MLHPRRNQFANKLLLPLGSMAILFVLGLSIPDGQAENITDLSIEELMSREVTSVSKTTQRFADAAAAVFVLSNDAIRRSGVTTLPEALRLVPGLHVARIDANQWAITSRGFNGRFANKLLVLVDGRTVYTPIFSGVYWEALDLPLADIERVEVVRGPGATIWGANAVNGIINVITKTARDTQGGQVSVSAGDEEQAVVDLRYGWQMHDNAAARLYARHARRDGLVDEFGDDANDDWDLTRGGFRIDWLASMSHALTLQGDIYKADIKRNYRLALPEEPGRLGLRLDHGELSGHSLLARWEQTRSLASRMALQFYYQREQRDDVFTNYTLDTVDMDFQHEFAPSAQQELIWGLGYRHSRDQFIAAEVLDMDPDERSYNLFSAFAQDRISLFDDRLELILGSKIEHNTFTGWELQPSFRALWKASVNQRLWFAVSRAMRTPSRGEDDSIVNFLSLPASPGTPPAIAELRGNSALNSEELIAYELGYRIWPTARLFIDVALFFNDYDDLRFAILDPQGITVGPNGIVLPVPLVNGEQGRTYGLELTVDWRPQNWWQLQLGYSYLRADLEKAGNFDAATIIPADLGDERNPRHQLSLRSSFDLFKGTELDLWLRYVDAISDLVVATPEGIGSVDDYFTLDVRLGWRFSENFEIFLVGRNLVDPTRVEYLNEANTFPVQTERSLYSQIRWGF
jgi:iron complex outermembrane receptor protein